LTHCGQLILGKKISKFDAIRCQLLRPKRTKFDFRWDFAPDPAEGAYSAPPYSLPVFKGPTSKGRAAEEGGKGKGEEKGKGRVGGKCVEKKGRGGARPQIFWPRTAPVSSGLCLVGSVWWNLVPELIPVLGSQPAGDVSHKPGGRLPLLSARPTVTLGTLMRAAVNFAAL